MHDIRICAIVRLSKRGPLLTEACLNKKRQCRHWYYSGCEGYDGCWSIQSASVWKIIEMFAEPWKKRALVDDGFVMDELNGNGKRGLPKLREILRRQKQDSEVGHDIS